MTGKQIGTTTIPLLQADRFLRKKARRAIENDRFLFVKRVARGILRRVLPARLRMALLRWWMEERKYPTSKAIDRRYLHRTIEREYGVSILDSYTVPAGCPANLIMTVTTNEGDFFAKVYTPDENSVELVREEAQLFEYLNRHGVHAPRLPQTGAGQTVLRINRAYPLILMKKETLRMLDTGNAKKEELFRIGQETAKMHQILRTYPRRGVFKKTLADPDFWRTDWETYHLILDTPLGRLFSQNDLAMVKATDRGIVEYMRTNYPPELNDFSVIHGDLAIEHAQFLPDGNVYFLDFGDVSWGPVAREIAVFFVRLYTSPLGAHAFERWEELRAWALEGYQSVNSLSEVDLAAIHPMMVKRLSEGTIGYDTDILEYERDPDAHIQKKRKRYELLEYLLNHG